MSWIAAEGTTGTSIVPGLDDFASRVGSAVSTMLASYGVVTATEEWRIDYSKQSARLAMLFFPGLEKTFKSRKIANFPGSTFVGHTGPNK